MGYLNSAGLANLITKAIDEMIIADLCSAVLRDPTAPSLSDLLKMWLEENVNDKSVVSLAPMAWDDRWTQEWGLEYDPNVVEIRLNKIRVACVLDSSAAVVLRRISASGVIMPQYDDVYVPAADPELLNKLWAHIAAVEESLNLQGFSLIDKPKPPPGFKKSDYEAYPADDSI